MRTITSVTRALARHSYHPQQRTMMSYNYYCRMNTGSMTCLQTQPMPYPCPQGRMNNNASARTFAVQPTMIKYMPIQTIDVR